MSKFNNLIFVKFVNFSLVVLRICFGDGIFRNRPE
ncbi:hypothetical protein SAMN05444409_0698 [Epilithonimonas zeae]|uniref:Uncharacterized protein n=1 Tax=Epilithonimonas zeae TaxID=1416779 RepID=A0A1N6EKK6_9FLAO|nr:hypothetical protein SAMN05444409_0698 [Epilithonimonas zeae]